MSKIKKITPWIAGLTAAWAAVANISGVIMSDDNHFYFDHAMAIATGNEPLNLSLDRQKGGLNLVLIDEKKSWSEEDRDRREKIYDDYQASNIEWMGSSRASNFISNAINYNPLKCGLSALFVPTSANRISFTFKDGKRVITFLCEDHFNDPYFGGGFKELITIRDDEGKVTGYERKPIDLDFPIANHS